MSANPNITARQYFQTVLDAHLSEDMDAMSAKYIAGLDARNEKRKSTDSKEKQAVRERAARVLNFLKFNEGQFTRDDIALGCDMTPAQVTAAVRVLGDSVKKAEVKIDKARRVVYSVTE